MTDVARLFIAGAGAYVGSMFGMPGLGYTLGSGLANMLLPGKLPGVVNEGPKPTDLNITSSALGTAIPIVKGRGRVSGNIIWSTPINPNPTTAVDEVGGKGKSPSQTVTTTTYDPVIDCAIAVCRGEMAGIRRIWSKGRLIYDRGSSASASSYIASNGEWDTATFYPGSASQEVDPTIDAALGGVATSAYLDTCYMVFTGLREQYRQMEFEVVEVGGNTFSHSILSTGAHDATPSKIWYLPTRNEVWCAVQTSAVDGNAKILIYDLTTGLLAETITPPGGKFASAADVLQGYINEAAGLLFLSSHTNGAPEAHAGVIDLATRSLIADFGVTLDGQYDSFTGTAYVIGGDETTIIWAVYAGGDWTLNIGDWTSGGITPGASVNVAGGEPLETCARDSRGVWWCCSQLHLFEFNSDTSLINVHPLFDQAPSYTAWVMDRPNTHYDPTRDCIYVLAKEQATGYYYICKYVISAQAWSTLVSFNDAEVSDIPTSLAYDSKSDQFCVERNNACVIRYEAATGTRIDKITLAESSADIILDPNDTPFFGGTPSVYVGNIHFGQVYRGIVEIRFNTVTPTARVLGDVVKELCAPVLGAADLDVTDLTDTVDGYVLGSVTTIRDAIGQLQIPYFFDAAEIDGKIVFVKRGGASVVTLDEESLGAHAYGSEPPPKAVIKRLLETELPREVRFNYFEDGADYQAGVQYERRLTGQSQAVHNFTAPVVMTASQAKDVTSKALYSAWAGRVSIEFRTTMQYAYLAPMSVVTLVIDGRTYAVRILSCFQDGGVLVWQSVVEDTSIFTQGGVGGGYAAISQAVFAPGGVMLQMLDLPTLRDQDDGPGFYAEVTGPAQNLGAELWSSADNVRYDNEEVAFTTLATVGRATTALGDFTGGNTIDAQNSFTVTLESGTLSSCTDADMFAGTNTAALYTASGVEVLNFGLATLVSAGTYTVSRFLRGRRGTAAYMGVHAVGDRFVWLSPSAIRYVKQSQADTGVERYWKTPAVGQAVRSALARRFTNTGVSQKPLPPVHLCAGVTANSAWDIVIGWIRCGRVAQEWLPYQDVPLSETSESYRVEIYESSAFTTFKRALTPVAAETATYTSAQQVADFGENQRTIHVKLVSISTEVGDGFPAYASLHAVGRVFHRYWRVNSIVVPGGGYLEISEIQVISEGADITSSATKTSSDVPNFGALADIFDGSLSTRNNWTEATAEGAGFWIKFTFTDAVAVTGIKQGGYDTSTRYMSGFVVQYSDDDSSWTTITTKSGLAYPGNNTLSGEYSVQ